jgi:hypothetical protein
MSLTTPTKPSKKAPVDLVDDSRRSTSPDTVSSDDEELAALRREFVGDINLPEGVFGYSMLLLYLTRSSGRPRASAHGNKTSFCSISHSIPRGSW